MQEVVKKILTKNRKVKTKPKRWPYSWR